MAKTKQDSLVDKTQEEAQKLLDLIGVEGKVTVSEEDEAITATIDTEETGIIIGRHGETIAAFELLLNQIVNRDQEEWKRVIVDTGGYKQKQEDKLRELALGAAQKVKESGEPYSLYDLTSAQRRIVHMILSEDTSLVTESEGEGRDRRLIIKNRS